MFKRTSVIVLALFLLLPSLAFAQDDLANIDEIAQYFPVDTIMLVVTRIDEDFFNLIETLTQPAIDLAGAAGTPTPSLREAINEGLADAGTDIDTVLSWLGDYAAIGITPAALIPTADGTPSEGFYVVVELDDRPGLDRFLASMMPVEYSAEVQGDYLVYMDPSQTSPAMAISDELLIIYPRTAGNLLLTREARLNSSEDFLSAVDALPADNYNILFFGQTSAVMQSMPVPLDAAGQMTLEAAPIAIGLTLLDDRSYVIDSAQLPLPGAAVNPPVPVDPAFARFIPGDASGVIHATDLTMLYYSLINFASLMNAGTGADTPPVSAQIEQGFAAFGFDLQDDILSWTTGDYALFFSSDVLDLLPSIVGGGAPDVNAIAAQFDVGLVIEATDPAKASAFATRLGGFIGAMAGGQEGITVSPETISGVEVTVISLSAPVDPQAVVQIDLLLGASEDVFFLATRQAAEAILSGDGMLDAAPGYIEAQALILPDPTTVLYATGEGVLLSASTAAIVPLALLGPAVGEVFSGVVADLESGMMMTATPAPTPTPLPTVPPPDPMQILEQLQAAVDSISSSSISATVTADGVTLLRFVITAAE